MSEPSTLLDLGHFSAESPLASNDAVRANEALWTLARSLGPARPMRQRVSEMVGVVMTLSARTRRMVHPRVSVDIDVFAPGGQRALRIFLPDAD